MDGAESSAEAVNATADPAKSLLSVKWSTNG